MQKWGKIDEVPYFTEGQIKFCSDSKQRNWKYFLWKKAEVFAVKQHIYSQVHVLLISETEWRKATNAKTQAARLVYRINREYLQQQKIVPVLSELCYHTVHLLKYIFDQNYVSLSHLVKGKRAWLIQSIHRHTSYWPSFPWNTTLMHITGCKLREDLYKLSVL